MQKGDGKQRQVISFVYFIFAIILLVVVDSFTFERKRGRPRKIVDNGELETWDDDIPRTLWSRDNVLLAAYLPNVIKEKGVVSVFVPIYLNFKLLKLV